MNDSTTHSAVENIPPSDEAPNVAKPSAPINLAEIRRLRAQSTERVASHQRQHRQAKPNAASDLVEPNGFPERYRTCAIDDLEPATENGAQLIALARIIIARFNELPPDRRNLICTGPSGAGKTLVASVIARSLSTVLGVQAAYCTHIEYDRGYDAERRGQDRGPHSHAGDGDDMPSPSDQLQLWRSCELLVLDNVFAQETLFADRLEDLLDRRYRDCKSVIAITRLTPRQLNRKLGDSAYRRLSEGAITLAFEENLFN